MLSVRAFVAKLGIDARGGLRLPILLTQRTAVRPWLRLDPPAASVPWVSSSMTPLLVNGPLGQKLTVAVVGDGFAEKDQELYNQKVDELLITGLFTQDYFVANKSAFNVYRINLVSVDSGVGTKTYDGPQPKGKVISQTDKNTALGIYYNGDRDWCWLTEGPETEPRRSLAVSMWLRDWTLVLVLVNNPGFGGCGGGGVATVTLGVSWATVAHEWGHGLGGLADEYSAKSETYKGAEPGEPNVTTNTDRKTLKWAWAVNSKTPIPTTYTSASKPPGWDESQSVGLFEGGKATFSKGIYRPVLNCRMNTDVPPFCPVCTAAMDLKLAQFGAKMASDAPVSLDREGDTAMPEPREEGYVRLVMRVENGQLRIVDAREVDGPLAQPPSVLPGLAHEVRVGDRRVAIESLPDAGVRRSFSEVGAEGPEEHRITRLEAFDFVARVPRHELRGADPAAITMHLVAVRTAPGDSGGERALASEPDVEPIASLMGVSPDDVPESLRRVIQGGR